MKSLSIPAPLSSSPALAVRWNCVLREESVPSAPRFPQGDFGGAWASTSANSALRVKLPRLGPLPSPSRLVIPHRHPRRLFGRSLRRAPFCEKAI